MSGQLRIPRSVPSTMVFLTTEMKKPRMFDVYVQERREVFVPDGSTTNGTPIQDISKFAESLLKDGWTHIVKVRHQPRGDDSPYEYKYRDFAVKCHRFLICREPSAHPIGSAIVSQISEILPIHGADFVELAVLSRPRIPEGVYVAVNKGMYSRGDQVIHVAPGSVIGPEYSSFLSQNKKALAEFYSCERKAHVRGHRIDKFKVKGVVSDGLVLPLSVLGPVRLIDGTLQGAEASDGEFKGTWPEIDVIGVLGA